MGNSQEKKFGKLVLATDQVKNSSFSLLNDGKIADNLFGYTAHGWNNGNTENLIIP